MSKQYTPQAAQTNGQTSYINQEYRIVKHDLIRVLILNAIYLAAILVLYFTNKESHYLENWFRSVFHF